MSQTPYPMQEQSGCFRLCRRRQKKFSRRMDKNFLKRISFTKQILIFWQELSIFQSFWKNINELQKTAAEILCFSEKRKHPRFNTSELAYCTMLGSNVERDKMEKARIIDISLSGLLLEHIYPYAMYSILEIEPLIDNQKMYLLGKICRTKRYDSEDGIKFTSGINIANLSEPDETLLNRYIEKLSSPSWAN